MCTIHPLFHSNLVENLPSTVGVERSSHVPPPYFCLVALICSVEARHSFSQSFIHLQSRTILRTYPISSRMSGVNISHQNRIFPRAISYLPTYLHTTNHHYQENPHRNPFELTLSTSSPADFRFIIRPVSSCLPHVTSCLPHVTHDGLFSPLDLPLDKFYILRLY